MTKKLSLLIGLLLSIFLSGCSSSTTPSTQIPARAGQEVIARGIHIVQLGQKVKIFISSDQCFEDNTSNIKENFEPNLDKLVAFLKVYSNKPMTITGYTDNVLQACPAILLSRARADSIVSYLWAHGIPHEQLYAKGRGAECPIAQNDTVGGSALNRRVEISLWTA
jgi:outer membrane protein OmpA-like peptidoglycan-associated protein